MRPSDDLDDDEREYAYEYDDEDRDYCDHENYEIDVCTGRATCEDCNYHWWATKEQVDAECERMARYSEWAAEQDAIERRRERWAWVHRLWLRAIEAWFRSKPRHVRDMDSEIPF